MIGLGFDTDPSLYKNERVQIKLAHSTYPAKEYQSQLDTSIKRINNYFKHGQAVLNKDIAQLSSNTCPSISRPVPPTTEDTQKHSGEHQEFWGKYSNYI